jgi:prefoldin subunit 5
VVVVSLLGVAPSPTAAGTITDADATIETLRREADQAADAYFETLAKAQALEAQIADVEARLPALEAERRELREAARDRAVAAYKRRGTQLSSIFGAEDALSLLRQTRLLDNLSAADNDAFEELSRVTERLQNQREKLQDARSSLQATLDELQARGNEIDGKLQAAEERRRQLAAEAAAAAARAQAAEPDAVAPAAPAPAPIVPYIGTPGAHPQHNHPFLVCTRGIESGGNYQAYNSAGPYMGAYQFLQSTWNSTANHAGRPGLIGVRPDHASQYDQDDMAWVLYQWQGSRPWNGRCG